jgi:hypothetical protein
MLLVIALALAARAFARADSEGLMLVGEEGQTCRNNIVVVVHGWLEGGRDNWGEYTAQAIADRVDPGRWSCGYYEWSKGAVTINPRDAARYARDEAGPHLAADMLALRNDYRHIHLVGHSSAAWLVSEAAKILAAETKADIHLTFLDAYVPLGWDQAQLGDVNMPGRTYWADHYYTRDLTLDVTGQKLTHAHNIDVTAIDPWFKDHNFPRYWYYATIAGRYPPHHLALKNEKVVSGCSGIEYGFSRSLEADPNAWQQSLKLPMGNTISAELKP